MPKVARRPFSAPAGHEPVTAYTLTNSQGASVEILDWGGIIRSLHVPDRYGRLGDVALGQDSVDAYHSNLSCVGALLGRNANRIACAAYRAGQTTVNLEANLGKHQIHGGRSGYSTKAFDADAGIADEGAYLSLHLIDIGLGGFPGTVAFQATFTFTEDNTLHIDYEAVPSEDTVLNPSHHVYLNLGGHESGVTDGHRFRLNATYYTPSDSEGLPTGEIRRVEGTVFDFRISRSVSEDIDHNFCIDGSGYRCAAKVVDASSGRTLTLLTDRPGVQFFTCNTMQPVRCKDGVVYPNHGGFCLETQHYPNAVNVPHFPSPLVRRGSRFRSRTTYAFSVQAKQ